MTKLSDAITLNLQPRLQRLFLKCRWELKKFYWLKIITFFKPMFNRIVRYVR